MIEPVHPRPTMTTSFAGSFLVMRPPLAFLWGPFGTARNAYGRMWIALIVSFDPIAIVVMRPGESDHLPPAHVPIAAVDRIGEKSALHILQQGVKKSLAIDALELDRSLLKALQDLILLVWWHVNPGFTAVLGLAVAIQCRKRGAVDLGRVLCRLRPLLFGAFYEWRMCVETVPMAI